MTAVVSRERARTTGLTAAAGALMLAVAFVMMIVAAPGHGPVRAHLARSSAVRLATDAPPLGGLFHRFPDAIAEAYRESLRRDAQRVISDRVVPAYATLQAYFRD